MSDKHYRNIRPMSGDSSRQPVDHPVVDGGRSSPDSQRKSGDSVKHRKVPDSITRNACLNCKKARAKCDGRTPCKRCSNRSEANECIYEIHLKHAKEDLVKQIKELQARESMSQQVFHALAADVDTQEILDMLREDESQEAIVQHLNRHSKVNQRSVSPPIPSLPEDGDQDMRDSASDAVAWTNVTNKASILDDLFQLYFTWVHPVHTFFDEGQFVQAYHAGDVDGSNYCSPVLVNALCAMACHLHLPSEVDSPRYLQLGYEFSDAVKETIDPDDMQLTTIQAMGAIALFDIARGDGLRASSLLQLALNCLMNLEAKCRSTDSEAWRVTFEGIQALNIGWALLTFQAPAKINPAIAANTYTEADVIVHDKIKWYLYTSSNEAVIAVPSLRATIARERSKLSSIVEEIATTLYAQQGLPISAQQVYPLCHRLVYWRTHFPAILVKLEEQGHAQTLPHFLYMLLLYSNALVQLLRPLLSYDGFPTHLIEDMVWSEAQSAFSLLETQYRRQFPLRCQPVLQLFALLHFAEVIARHFPGGLENQSKDGPEALKTAINILEKSKQSVPVVEIMQEMLRRAAVSCSIRLSSKDSMMGSNPSPKQFCMNDFIQACTRSTFVQPAAEIQRKLSPSFIDDWLALHDTRDLVNSSSSITSSDKDLVGKSPMNITTLLNRQ